MLNSDRTIVSIFDKKNLCMCVDKMEGYSGAGDCSSEDMVSWLSTSEDDLDIVGEDTMYDSTDEAPLEASSPSVPLCPIVECTGLSRASWVNLDVVLHNDNGVAVAEGICRNTNPQDCVDEKHLGPDDVGVVILESLVHSEVDPTHRFSLRRWPLRNVTIDGVSLLDHERQHMQNQKEILAHTRPRKGLRKYDTLARSTPTANEPKRQRFLEEESIREVATKIVVCIVVVNCSQGIN